MLYLSTAQLQKLDDSSSASNEYESVREHLEPWLKAGLSAAHAASHHSQKTPHLSSHRPTNAIAAAARALSHSNSTMSREIPSSIASASRFNSLHNLAAMHRSSSLRSGLGKLDATSAANQKDELKPYQSRQKTKAKPADTELARARALKSVSSLEQLSKVEQKRYLSASQPIIINDLLPQRIPLRSKRTKRCPTCKHIVVKPDTKAASTRFKIRLVASNYLPQIVRRSFLFLIPSTNCHLLGCTSSRPAFTGNAPLCSWRNECGWIGICLSQRTDIYQRTSHYYYFRCRDIDRYW